MDDPAVPGPQQPSTATAEAVWTAIRSTDRFDRLPTQLVGLTLTDRATEGRFLIEGGLGQVHGPRRGPLVVDGAGLDSLLVDTPNAPVANLLIQPGLARRERVGREGIWTETCLVAPNAPWIAVQWDSETGGGPGEVRVTLPPDCTADQGAGGERGLVVHTPAGEAALAWGTGARLARVDASADRETVELELVGPPPWTLVICPAPEHAVVRALAAARHLVGHAVGSGRGPAEDPLALRTGVAEIDEGVAWCHARLARQIDRCVDGGRRIEPALGLTLGLAALASADGERAERLATHPSLTGTGYAGALRRAVARHAEGSLRADDEQLPGPPRRSLPMLKSDGIDVRGRIVAAWQDADAAWITWRTRLERGLRNGPVGPGTWDALEAQDEHESRTAELVLALAYGLLGLDVDAPAGRLTVSPRLPSHLAKLQVDCIPLGESRLGLRYERHGRTELYEIEPLRAAVPPMVILEMRTSAPVAGVRIDGQDARLDVHREESGYVTPVQIPVDGTRRIEIDRRESPA